MTSKCDKFKYFGMRVSNQILINLEIKSRPNSGNVFYRSVQNLLSPRLVYENVKIKKVLSPVVLLWV
jgi:hypothetical protein